MPKKLGNQLPSTRASVQIRSFVRDSFLAQLLQRRDTHLNLVHCFTDGDFSLVGLGSKSSKAKDYVAQKYNIR